MTSQGRHLRFNVHVMPSGAAYWVLTERRGPSGDRVLGRGVLGNPLEHQALGDLDTLALCVEDACSLNR